MNRPVCPLCTDSYCPMRSPELLAVICTDGDIHMRKHLQGDGNYKETVVNFWKFQNHFTEEKILLKGNEEESYSQVATASFDKPFNKINSEHV